MNKKSPLLIIAVIALSAVMVISAALVYNLNVTMTGTVPPSGTVTVTIDSVTYSDGQSMAIAWGTVALGANTKQITITNNYNAPVTPAISSSNLPTGWTLALSETSAIAAKTSVNVNIVLTVPSDALANSYGWSAQITASTA